MNIDDAMEITVADILAAAIVRLQEHREIVEKQVGNSSDLRPNFLQLNTPEGENR